MRFVNNFRKKIIHISNLAKGLPLYLPIDFIKIILKPYSKTER